MKSIAHPNIFNRVKNSTKIAEDKIAIGQDLKLLVLTTKTECFGDPYIGNNLRGLLFSLNDKVLVDLVIDEIYSSIKLCMPMIIVERKDITIIQERSKVIAKIRLKYILDNTYDLYTIPLSIGGQ